MRAKLTPGHTHKRLRAIARRFAAAALTTAFQLGAFAAAAPVAMPPSLANLSLEELANLEVTTVSRRSEAQRSVAAVVYVITADQIRRSGATSIPEALRLAPGVEVAKLDSHTWAISIRGFNSTTANKLLVLIDGRSVYTPLYSGVFWDVQDTLIADIERIEVIAGPGGTLWGSNAVNGVINVITRHGRETLGTYVEAGGGDEERAFGAVRHGVTLGDSSYLRGYAKHYERAASALASGGEAHDNWRMTQGGFRLDWERGPTILALQGDGYSGKIGTRYLEYGPPPNIGTGILREGAATIGGANLLGRLERSTSERSRWQLQGYYDRTERHLPGAFDAEHVTFDLDFQQQLAIGQHNLGWGLGFRQVRDDITNTFLIAFLPETTTTELWSGFLQDHITMWAGRVALTVGSKVEDNASTGLELQPSLRLAWRLDERQTAWAAATRAVRSPSRLDRDLVLTAPVAVPSIPIPVLVEIRGNPEFDSETVLSYEAGYRLHANQALSFDAALFYNDYSSLRSTEPEAPRVVLDPTYPHIVLPNRIANGIGATSRGAVFEVKWSLRSLLVQTAYSYLDIAARPTGMSRDTSGALSIEGSSPKNQASIHLYFDLPRDLDAYVGVRYVDHLAAGAVPSYFGLDLGLGWRPRPGFEISLGGRNLLESRHREFEGASLLLKRSAFGKLTWSL